MYRLNRLIHAFINILVKLVISSIFIFQFTIHNNFSRKMQRCVAGNRNSFTVNYIWFVIYIVNVWFVSVVFINKKGVVGLLKLEK